MSRYKPTSSSAFGFLASKEVKAAGLGNIGLQDRESQPTWKVDFVNDTTCKQNGNLSAGFKSISEHLGEIRQK